MICPLCKGEGRLFGGRPCGACDGYGAGRGAVTQSPGARARARRRGAFAADTIDSRYTNRRYHLAPRNAHCECGTRLSRYSIEAKCWQCQYQPKRTPQHEADSLPGRAD